MVQFKNLKNDPKNRKVRQIVESQTGVIKVFEPSEEDVREIMKLQDLIVSMNQEIVDEEEIGHFLNVSGLTIIRSVIPLLTDLEFDEDMTDEELQDIIDHPNLALMEVNQVLSSIITSVYKMMILSTANRLSENDMMLETYKVDNAAMNKAVLLASQTDDGLQVIQEVQQKEQALDQALERENKVVDLSDYKKPVQETEESGKDYQDKLYEEKVLAHYEDLMDD